MTLNAFWGSKKVFVVNETGCQLAKEIVKELREANFNKAEELKTFDYSAIADAKADYVLSVSEDNECDIIPYKAEGFVGDRLGHHVNRTFDEDRSRFAYKDHFEAAGYDIQTNSSRQLNWERAKKEEWFYDDHNFSSSNLLFSKSLFLNSSFCAIEIGPSESELLDNKEIK